MAKRGYTVIAEHFGTDEESIKDSEYQPGRFNCKVYSLPENAYISANKTRPKDTDGAFIAGNWKQIQSSYDKTRTLWVYAQ